MGNQMCCQELRHEMYELQKLQDSVNKKQLGSQSKNNVYQIEHVQTSQLPPLCKNVQDCINRYEFYSEQLKNTPKTIKKYGNLVYQGNIDHQTNKPHGFGKMYQVDGSIYMGNFVFGKAEGKGTFILADGSFYNGDFVKNQAECQIGYFKSDDLTYSGGFKNNTFDGKGREKGKNHEFDGTYQNGHKQNGILKWKVNDFENIYNGTFNDNNQFNGKGTLKDAKGTFQGYFLDGQKSGEGYYKGVNGIKYKGCYKKGVRSGKGILYNQDDSIAFQGDHLNGFPNGKGWIYKNGVKIESNWIDGIDSSLLNE